MTPLSPGHDLPARPGAPFVLAVGGLVASGKSTLARALAERLGAARLEADREREVLLGAGGDVHEAESLRSFAPETEVRVYDALVQGGEEALARGDGVVLDGCFARATQRAAARALARRHGCPFLFVECLAAPEVVRARLAGRDVGRAGRSGDWSLLARELATRWERIDWLAADEHQRVDTGGDLGVALAAVEARIAVWLRPPEALARTFDAVTFDCWNTLIFEADWPLAHARRVDAVMAAAAEAGRPVSREAAAAAFDAAWAHHMASWRNGVATGAREIAVAALAALHLEERHVAFEHLVGHFEEASHSGRVAALPGARETLEALAGAGVHCALVCDTGLTPGRVVRRHLDRLGLLAPLAVQVFSDEIGVPKPDPRAFHAALDPPGIPPSHAVHVGDLRRTDVAGARALGMRSVRIRARHDDASDLPEADAVVSTHAELRVLLGGPLDGDLVA